MIHILFGAAASGSLKHALRKMGLDKKDKVISFWDIFSIGPIYKLNEEIGVKSRFKWMEKCMSDEFDEIPNYLKDFKRSLHQINSVADGEHVIIWVADNAHEQVGLRFAVYLLKDKNMNINVINTTKEYEKRFPVKNVKYTLLHSGEMIPEKFQHIYEHGAGNLMTDHDRTGLKKEWLSLAETRETLRIWQNEKICSVSEDYFDEFIIDKVKKLHGKGKERKFINSARVIGEVIGHLDQYVGDTFLEYRIRKLIEVGVIESKGRLEAMRFYSIRLKC
ncbi:DUF1835 domain-containing protein [Heyndrickxia coagulans]|uniref:DUF1835 domain-containing protein n=1 Tax=Heyndrickxia coagulans TaxID=1398 RepID=UPI001A94789B|nr:DUF1835 domain-containing protein [Heyndrickxia coagulans]